MENLPRGRPSMMHLEQTKKWNFLKCNRTSRLVNKKKALQNELAPLHDKFASDKKRLESESKVQEIKVKAEKEAKDVRDLQQ